MKFLCLAYGDEDGWSALSEAAKREVLAQDARIRDRGNLVSAVHGPATSVRNWDGNLEIGEVTAAQNGLPLAGFSLIEAESMDEVVNLVSKTPCARASGVIEIWPFVDAHDTGAH